MNDILEKIRELRGLEFQAGYEYADNQADSGPSNRVKAKANKLMAEIEQIIDSLPEEVWDEIPD